jgi:hypothetical protein
MRQDGTSLSLWTNWAAVLTDAILVLSSIVSIWPGATGAVLCGSALCCCRGRGLASAALTYLLGDDEDLEPENSRTALLLAPGKNPSVLDVAVVAAQQVRKLS